MRRVLGLTLTACLVLTLSACSGGSDKKGKDGKDGGSKSNAEKLVGTWELVKSSEAGPAPEMTVVFTKDGKMTMKMKGGGDTVKDKDATKLKDKVGAKEETLEASYKVDGDKITVKMKRSGGMEKSETLTIKTLTDTKLVTEDEHKQSAEFRKK